MDKTKRQRINWLLDFLNTDLNELKLKNYSELQEVTVKVIHHIVLSEYRIFNGDSMLFPTDKSESNRKEAELNLEIREARRATNPSEIQGKEILELLKIQRNGDIQLTTDLEKYVERRTGFDLFMLQDRLREELEPLFKRLDDIQNGRKTDGELLFNRTITVQRCMNTVNGRIAITGEGMLGVSTIDLFIWDLMACLNQVPIDSFKKCEAPGCNNWVVQLTEREKKFCSNRCAANIGMKRSRTKAKKPRAGEKKEK
ncbi:hypothetical protein KKI24_11610 [bacterium]|nr:hypothetical protein [bacterium]